LQDAEKAGMEDLQEFVRICEANKSRDLKSGSRSTLPLLDRDTSCSSQPHSQLDDDQGASWRGSSAATDGLSTLHVSPRLTRLSPLTGNGIEERGNIRSQPARPRWSRDEYSDQTPTTGLQTRFIPSVGWCIRYGSRISQGGRYHIMFLDGVTLGVDVDEEHVEFTSRSGVVTRRKICDCNSKRKLGDRMKVFKEFVSMFDDDQGDT